MTCELKAKLIMLGFGLPDITAQPVIQKPKKSKWDNTTMKTVMPNVACILPPHLGAEVLHALLLRFQLEEVEYKLTHLEDEKNNVNYGENAFLSVDNKLQLPPDVIARDTLVSERRRIIESIEEIFPAFRPPLSILLTLQKAVRRMDLTSPQQFNLILGPRAQTLKGLERDYNVHISIRASPLKKDENPEEKTDFGHVIVIGNNEDDVERCMKKIETIITIEDELIPEEIHEVNIEEYSLSFDPTLETLPWEESKNLYLNNESKHESERVFNRAIDDILDEINGGIRDEEYESVERQTLLNPFYIDLARQDISCALTEPPPPGSV